MKILYFAFAAMLITSCNSEKDAPLEPASTFSEYILVGNEGAYGGESASLTAIERDAGTVSEDVFSQANDNATLGDVLQSMVERDGEIYLVLNNSGKIEVVDSKTFTLKRTITGFASPRYICFVSDDEAYVSNYGAAQLDVINPKTGTFTTSISTPNYIENMAVYNDEMWCTAPGSDKLYFLDVHTNQITDSLTLRLGVTEIARDANNDFWVFAKGAFSAPEVIPAIYLIDGETKEIIRTFQFPDNATTAFAESMTMSSDGEFLLFLMNNDVYRMSVSSDNLPTDPFISNLGFTAYAMSVNSESGEISLADAVDFVQSGNVHFYTADGESIDMYETGILPHSVLWVKN